jgi:hypothetical protein
LDAKYFQNGGKNGRISHKSEITVLRFSLVL